MHYTEIKKEYIICSAIWYKDLDLKYPEALENWGIRPYNVKRGIVFGGWRHPNCMYQMVAITGLYSKENVVGKIVQGFLTNKNNFVDREEGMVIARRENQLLEPERISKRLFSEDIY